MSPFVVRRSPADFSFSPPVRPLIPDWRAATPKFISGLTERLEGFPELRSPDWEVTDSGVIQDRSCRCRLFAGAATIALKSDGIALNFSNVARQAHEVVFEIFRRTLGLMDSEFASHPYDSCNLICTQHADALDPETGDAYLAQFSYPGTSLALEEFPHVIYEPSLRVLLPGVNGEFKLQRTVERSAAQPGALFVSTSILLSREMIASASAPEMAQFFEEGCRCADKAIALEWEALP